MTTKRTTSFGTYKQLNITKPTTITANDTCPICLDTASKRKLRNPCAFEIHKLYLTMRPSDLDEFVLNDRDGALD